jgi:hypothetical protein
MAIEANNSLRGLDSDVGLVVTVLDAVAGVASQSDGGMNVLSVHMVGMTFQAI